MSSMTENQKKYIDELRKIPQLKDAEFKEDYLNQYRCRVNTFDIWVNDKWVEIVGLSGNLSNLVVSGDKIEVWKNTIDFRQNDHWVASIPYTMLFGDSK